MKTKILLSLPLIILLFACSGNAYMPKINTEIPVTSEPSAASVYVMGERLGTTPMVIDLKLIYPVTYAKEDVQSYGRITLKRENCSDQIITVTAQMVSDGIKARMDCIGSNENVVRKSGVVGKAASQRLKELQALKDQGLINEEEYQNIRNRILHSL